MLRSFLRPRSLVGLMISRRRCLSTRATDPLRILFCGSDEFSCASLKAIYEEKIRNKDLVESLDVMVLPPKRAGRGYKDIREGETRMAHGELATELIIAGSAMQGVGGRNGLGDSSARYLYEMGGECPDGRRRSRYSVAND